METVGLFDAWGLWLSGKPTVNHLLWGLDILWWGRIGKITEFTAALAVIAEIIGADRLRAFGQSLHGQITLERLGKTFSHSLGFLKDTFLYFWEAVVKDNDEKAELVLDRWARSPLAYLNLALSMIIAVFLGAEFYDSGVLQEAAWFFRLMVSFILGMLSLFIIYVTISPIIVAFLAVSSIIMGFLADLIFVEPIAFIIERKNIDKLIKVLSALLLLIGFHFDLLAS